MINPETVPDFAQNFGFWLVDNTIVFSKVQSILQAQDRNTHDVRFYYHDHVYSNCNWSHHNETSLQDLYAQRALQLRNQYDYLIFLYSGGSDSSNALKTFLNNDIKLDEVACWYTSYNENTIRTNLEIRNAASGMLEKIVKDHNIKVRKIDEREYFQKLNLIKDWTLHAEPTISPNQLCKEDMLYRNPDWLKLLDSGKRVAVIVGLEKPRIFYDDNSWYASFLDLSNAFNFEKPHRINHGIVLEPFYISPNFPEITIKQSHILMNYINLTYSKDFIVKNFSNDSHFNEKLYFKLVRNLLYPYWDDNTYSIGKDKPMYSEKYRWLWDSKTDFSKIYNEGLENLEKQIDPYFLNGGQLKKGLMGCWSRKYKLNV